MITFNNNIRQFSTKHNLTQKQAAGIGGVGYAGTMYALRKAYISKLIDSGVDPKEAKRRAKAKYGGMVGNAIKGAIGGVGVNSAARSVNSLKRSVQSDIRHQRAVRNRAANIKAIREANNPTPETPKSPNALQKAGHGMGNFLNSFEPLRNFGNRFRDPK